MNQMTGPATGFTTLAEIEAFEATPFADRTLPATTYEALKAGTARNPKAPAISFFVSGTTYDRPHVTSHGELMTKVTQTANAFRKLGIGREDVVAYVLPNLPETHFTIWGGSAAGQVLAINPLLEADQIADLLKAARAKVLVTLEKTPKTDLWEKCAEAAAGVQTLQHVVTCSVLDYIPGAAVTALKTINRLKTRRLKAGNRSLPVTRFAKLIKGANASELNFDPPRPEDVSTMLCTGGTTGLPKIARRSHHSEVYDCWAVSHFNPTAASPEATVFCGLPLFHSNAILVTGLLTFMSGGHVVLATPQGYRGDKVIENFWKIADHYKFVTFSGVPTVYAGIIDLPRDGLDISHISFGVCGAAPMPVELFNAFVEKTGIPIVEGYGLTEGAVASSLNPTHPDGGPRIGSIGLRLPYQHMRCASLDEAGRFQRWAETDEVGVILISGPNVFEGYIIERQNDGIFHDIDGTRWFDTGDLARQDPDGYFWMTGRKKELIIRGGHNIDPKIVEEAMHKHEAVAMAAVVGRPDAKVGELPVMYYQKAPGAEVDAAALAAFAEIHVPERAAIPKDYICLDALPVTGVGKIHKVTLNMMEIERTIRAEAEKSGVTLTRLEVAQDNQRGIVAHVNAATGAEALRKALGSFTFNVDYG